MDAYRARLLEVVEGTTASEIIEGALEGSEDQDAVWFGQSIGEHGLDDGALAGALLSILPNQTIGIRLDATRTPLWNARMLGTLSHIAGERLDLLVPTDDARSGSAVHDLFFLLALWKESSIADFLGLSPIGRIPNVWMMGRHGKRIADSRPFGWVRQGKPWEGVSPSGLELRVQESRIAGR